MLTPTLWIDKQALTIELFSLALRQVVSKNGNEQVFKSKTIGRKTKTIQRLAELGYRPNLKCSARFQITSYAGETSLVFVPLKNSPSNLSV